MMSCDYHYVNKYSEEKVVESLQCASIGMLE